MPAGSQSKIETLRNAAPAAGIHLVLATQWPDRTVVTGLIKSNLPMKVCLRVANATNSQIVLGEPGKAACDG
jgi:S-DNA-T family DNA segregation ATPase FtsK/SpoIIIE